MLDALQRLFRGPDYGPSFGAATRYAIYEPRLAQAFHEHCGGTPPTYEWYYAELPWIQSFQPLTVPAEAQALYDKCGLGKEHLDKVKSGCVRPDLVGRKPGYRDIIWGKDESTAPVPLIEMPAFPGDFGEGKHHSQVPPKDKRVMVVTAIHLHIPNGDVDELICRSVLPYLLLRAVHHLHEKLDLPFLPPIPDDPDMLERERKKQLEEKRKRRDADRERLERNEAALTEEGGEGDEEMDRASMEQVLKNSRQVFEEHSKVVDEELANEDLPESIAGRENALKRLRKKRQVIIECWESRQHQVGVVEFYYQRSHPSFYDTIFYLRFAPDHAYLLKRQGRVAFDLFTHQILHGTQEDIKR